MLGFGACASDAAIVVDRQQAATQASQTLLSAIGECDSAYQADVGDSPAAAERIAVSQTRAACVVRANDGAVPALESLTAVTNLRGTFSVFREAADKSCRIASSVHGEGTDTFTLTRLACADQWEHALSIAILDSLAELEPLVVPDASATPRD